MGTDTNERCEVCRFWKAEPKWEDGYCHRCPPAAVFITGEEPTMRRGQWPVTHYEDWCGEFARKQP
jgi:hypothetical protein